MRYLGVATDYDGTLARDGRVESDAVDVLERLSTSGRKLVLVTGRVLDDLQEVFPQLDLFDRVVAENGALLYRPHDRSAQPLADPPPERFVSMLRDEGVKPLSTGAVIVATWRPHEDTVLSCIQQLGLELQVIFNKGAVMVLPSGVNKATGLGAALKELGLSFKNAAGIGDAENDHAFVAACECAVATANALPALKEHCDLVTSASHGAGFVEMAQALLTDDLAGVETRADRAGIQLGERLDGVRLTLAPYGDNVLVAGPSGSGKSTLVTGLIERFLDAGYQLCVIDPEGDYAPLPHAVMLGDAERAPTVDETMAVLDHPDESVAVNLLGTSLKDRPSFLEALMPRLHDLRARTGRPNWLVVDEAHHMLHPERSPSALTLPAQMSGMIFVTVHPDRLVERVLSSVSIVVATGDDPMSVLKGYAGAVGVDAPGLDAMPEPGNAVAWDAARERRAIPFRIARSNVQARRHVRKYAHGDLGDQSFIFRGPHGKLNLRAHNLDMFVRLAEGVDDETWEHHLRAGHISEWMRSRIKDDELAGEVARLEDGSLSPALSRERVREAIERRYTAPAE